MFARASIYSALAALVAVLGTTLAISMVQEGLSTLANGSLNEHLYFLPLYGVRDRFLSLILPVLFIGISIAIGFQALLRPELRLRLGLAVFAAIAIGIPLLYVLFEWLLQLDQTKPGVHELRNLLRSQRLVVQGTGLSVWFSAGVLTALSLTLFERRGMPRRSRIPLGLAGVAVFGAVLLVFLGTHLRHRFARVPDRRNVVLIVLDTVTATHMAGYGYERVTTPEIDRLAARGVLFLNSFAAAPWTLPSHASMFTGLYPMAHHATQENLTLGDASVTLAELLRNQGYHAYAAINNAVLSRAGSNLHQGFGSYQEMYRERVKAAYAASERHPTNRAVEVFLDSIPADDRYFIFLNYIEAHSPYTPPREMAERFLEDEAEQAANVAEEYGWDTFYMEDRRPSPREVAALRGLYDAELAGLSTTIGDLVSILERRGDLDETLVIVTSDHGENIADNDHMGHVFSLNDTLLRVPLVLLGGGLPKGIERRDPVTSVDLFHTILAATRTPFDPGRSHGRDLLAADAEHAPQQGLVAEYYYPQQVLEVLARRGRNYESQFEAQLAPYLCRMRSLRRGDWKLIWRSNGDHALYHLALDPAEEHNLASQEPERMREMQALLLARASSLSGRELRTIVEPFRPENQQSGGFDGVDAETLEELKALGYAK